MSKKKKHKTVWRLSVPLEFPTYGIMVKWLRERHNLSQEQLAEALGTRQPSIARLENTNKSPSFKRMLKISNFFKLEMSAPSFGSLEEHKRKKEKSRNKA